MITWDGAVSLFFANENMRQSFLKMGYLFERLMGLLLIAFSVRLFWSAFRSIPSTFPGQ